MYVNKTMILGVKPTSISWSGEARNSSKTKSIGNVGANVSEILEPNVPPISGQVVYSIYPINEIEF